MPFTSTTAKEHGRKGGLKTKAKMTAHDPNWYSNIGIIGGMKMKERGPEYFSAMGKMKSKPGKNPRGVHNV